MRKALGLTWLLVVLTAGAYLAWQSAHGLPLRTDLMALLPQDERDPAAAAANDAVLQNLSKKILFLVGNPDRVQARAAAALLTRRLTESGLAEIATDGLGKDRLRQIGALYYPYRQGLLADADRERLLAGKEQELADRALSQVYGFMGIADARLLSRDPFLLLQSFFTSLPLPDSKLTLDDGMLTTSDGAMTWIFVSGQLTGEPYALDLQKALQSRIDLPGLAAAVPGTRVLKLGAVFFAEAGARQAIGESSTIGTVSTIGSVLVVLLAFRALAPLWLSLLVIGTGVGTALAGCLWLFGEVHVGALLFGVSLIGVSVDYSLQYCTEIFGRPATPQDRLRRVFGGIGLGTTTTVIGYLTLFLAPFPGLHQIAAFSAIGLVASWLTVVLWLPFLDRSKPPRHGAALLAAAMVLFSAWHAKPWKKARQAFLAVLLAAAFAGLFRLHADDDVRRMQSLDPGLAAEQDAILRLTGSTAGTQFFLVDAPDDETALSQEEALVERLRPLVAAGALAGFQAPAQYVPSAARQRENRALVQSRLAPLVDAQWDRLGLSGERPPSAPEDGWRPLTLADATGANGPLGFIRSLILHPGLHVVSLDRVTRPDAVTAAAAGLSGVRFVDPAGQFSALLAKYRQRALVLLAISGLLMAPVLLWRYGMKRSLVVMRAPVLAVLLTPPLLALTGAAFNFFDAMGLVLVLSIGMDYAVFCAETTDDRRPVTMLAVTLAAATALLSFGLLALSGAHAVSSFGSTMLTGILLAFLFAPWGSRPAEGSISPEKNAIWSANGDHRDSLGN